MTEAKEPYPNTHPFSNEYIGHIKAKELKVARCICKEGRAPDDTLAVLLCPFHGR